MTESMTVFKDRESCERDIDALRRNRTLKNMYRKSVIRVYGKKVAASMEIADGFDAGFMKKRKIGEDKNVD